MRIEKFMFGTVHHTRCSCSHGELQHQLFIFAPTDQQYHPASIRNAMFTIVTITVIVVIIIIVQLFALSLESRSTKHTKALMELIGSQRFSSMSMLGSSPSSPGLVTPTRFMIILLEMQAESDDFHHVPQRCGCVVIVFPNHIRVIWINASCI